MANRFLADASSEKAIFDFLCLPKMGLAPGQGSESTARLAKYPDISAPQVSRPSGETFRSSPSAEKQVELGRLGNAARILGEENSFASPSADVLHELRHKHPVGPLFPFGNLVGQSTPKPPTQEQLLDSFRTFKHDTAPGVSGWTVPLLKVAMQSDAVKKMLTMLAGMLLAGTAPGRNFLCSSRLIALDKPDGGVRPIAVGELIYRLCTKAILRCSFKPDCLSPSQFGVGTRGGVEPLIRAVQRAVDGSIEGQNFTHITSLDFSNAFNTLDRSELASSIRRHAGGLYRLAKWAYDSPSDLILGGIQAPPEVICSSQGVRQGDPLGPLLFSIGIRPIIEDLSNALGPDCVVLAYLDDMYILSSSADTLSRVEDFFALNERSLKLNVAKSFTNSVEDIKTNGIKMLGTCLGPKEVRAEFLQGKIEELETKIGRLVGLPHQHALLLLRQCLQQDLRHLQRCLFSDDLTDLWSKLDQIIWDSALRMRGAKEIPGLDTSTLDNQLLSLPVRLGGLGLLSHHVCAPLAFSAANDISDNLLVPLLGPPVQPPRLVNPDDPASIAPQRTRCNEVFECQRNALLNELDGHQMKTIIESASGLGKKWLFVVPFYQSLRLTDFEVSTGLHSRTLHPGSDSACPQCHALNAIGHADICVHRKRWNIARHEQVKRAIASTLSKIEGATVAVEPHIGETNRRNDIRITGSEASGLASHEYEVTVVSLKSRDSVETRLPPNLLPTEPAERGHALIGRFLDQTAANKRSRLPEVRRRIAFTPLVFSMGGCMDKGTIACLRLWQGVLPPSAFSAMCQQLSLILLRARAKSFVA